MITVSSNEFKEIGYNTEEHSIYVRDTHNQIHIFENKSKEEFDQFINSKQHDYFYVHILKKLQHKIIEYH
ncbi:MAG: hypothetical protein JWM44_1054 [Bacilli bacterium]|jgi:hypothetical protein|nr:hypothetical protein [Bacilli bacterium]